MLKKVYKWIVVFLLFFCFMQFSFADSDYENDYTLIDCINWNDSTWVAFDSEQPYKTLKLGIEETINYINQNINKTWIEETASWKIFNIKVNCTWINLLDWKISLDFYWNQYKNELIIEWVWENSLIIKNTYFYLPNNSWNINFVNANFEIWDKYNYYFLAQDNIVDFYSSWFKIINSNISLKNWYNLSYDKGQYYSLVYSNGHRYRYKTYYFYSNQQLIYNSNIQIELNADYNFAMPVLLKDSKIDFINSWTGSTYNVKFLPTHSPDYSTKANFSTFISNEINLWWNNFSTVNNEDFWFINNKFSNFNDFIFWSNLEDTNKTIFINNLIENNKTINISASVNLLNNVFKTDFEDLYDIFNYRKNYNISNIWAKWISWVFKINHSYNYFDLDFSSSSLYEEITWETIPKSDGEVYIIYQ